MPQLHNSDILRLRHTIFANIISKADVRRSRLVWIETSYENTFPRSHYARYACLKVLPAHKITQRQGKNAQGDLYGKEVLSGLERREREVLKRRSCPYL